MKDLKITEQEMEEMMKCGFVRSADVPVQGKEHPWPVMEQPLPHEVFLQRYVLARARAGQNCNGEGLAKGAEKAWQEIKASIAAETGVPQ
jgi:hypothetical protein